MRIQQTVLFSLMLSAQAHATFYKIDEKNCARALVQISRGNWASSNTHTLFRPLVGRRYMSTKMTEVIHMAFVLPTILDHAIFFGGLTEAEKTLLRSIRFAMPKEDPLTKIRFVSAKSNRIAVTGNHVGDKIYINSDRIDSLDYHDIVALLVHEYGHHHGIRDDEMRFLDDLGAKVARSIQLETFDLAAHGLPNFKITRFELGTPDSRESSNLDVFGLDEHGNLPPEHPADLDFGTHLVVSDGRVNHDLRELLRLHAFKDQTLFDLQMHRMQWRIENNALVLRVLAQFRLVWDRIEFYDVVIPLRSENGVARIERNPFVVEVKGPSKPQLLQWLWKDMDWYPEPAINGYNLKMVKSDRGTRVEIDFEERAYPLPFAYSVHMMWVQEFKLPNGRILRSRLPNTHALTTFKPDAYQLENLGPVADSPRQLHRFRLRTEPRQVNFAMGDVKLAAILVSPYREYTMGVVPEFFAPLIGGDTRQAYKLLNPVAPKQTKILSLKWMDDRHFSVEFELTEDFPIRSAADMSLFRSIDAFRDDPFEQEVNSIIANFGNHDDRTRVGVGLELHLAQGFDIFMGRPKDFSITEKDGKRIVHLPLRLGVSRLLAADTISGFREYKPPSILKVDGLMFRLSSDLSAWYLPLDLELQLQ